MKVKITKLKMAQEGWKRITGVHFKLDDEDYFLHYSGAEYEDVLTLYKGRNKGHVTRISSCYGTLDENFIKFIKKAPCLKYIDTEYFIKRLKEKGLLYE